jgi:ribose transport system substrate-binding protein
MGIVTNLEGMGMRRLGSGRLTLLAATLASALVLAACGGDDEDGGGSSAGGGAETTADTSANKAKAEQAIAEFTGKPSPFPVTEPLQEKPAGIEMAFMDCGTPICGLFRALTGAGAKAMGADFASVKGGASGEAVNAGFNSILERDPDAVIAPAVDPRQWQQQLEEFKEKEIPVAVTGIVNEAEFGLDQAPNSTALGKEHTERAAKLLANWVYANYGEEANVQFSWVPELAFSGLEKDVFTAEMKALCPSCEVHDLKVGVATLGNRAPQTIVSDLQANPDTNVLVASVSEQFNGLPPAMRTAGFSAAKPGEKLEAGSKVAVVGTGATPLNLQYLKDGQQTVDLAVDFPIVAWTLVDGAARGAVGQDPKPGLPVIQFLTGEDIKGDASRGWTGYPDFAERFMKLWQGGGE